MSVVAYADETTSLAEAPAESAAVAEVNESEPSTESVDEIDSSTASGVSEDFVDVDLDEVYVNLNFVNVRSDLKSLLSSDSFDVVLVDEGGNSSKGVADFGSIDGTSLVVRFETKGLKTSKGVKFECNSSIVRILDDSKNSDGIVLFETYKMDDAIMGSKDYPFGVLMNYVNEQFVTVKTVDENGNSVSSVPLCFEDGKGLTVELVTDSNGVAKLSADKYAGMSLKVRSLNSKYTIPVGLIVNTDKSEIVIPTEFDASEVKESALILNVKTDVLTDISSNWAEFTLELTDSNGVKQSIVNKSVGVTTHKVPTGNYSVKVISSPYTTVKVTNSVSISGSTSLDVSVYPLSTFEIYDGGKEYDFEILGVSHLEGRHYTGTEKKVFGVMPGTVVQLKSDNVDKAYTVTSDDVNEKVTVELSKGTTSATPVGAPKTFDIIDALLILAVLLLLGLISGGVYLYKTGALKSKNVTAMLLVFAMLCTMLPANIGYENVYAYSDGSPANASGGKPSTAHFRLTHDLPIVLKFTLVPTMPAGGRGGYPKATHPNSPFTKKGWAQPTLDEFTPVSELNNPLENTSKYDFTSLYLVLNSSEKASGLWVQDNNATAWINGGVLRYTNDNDGSKAKIVMGYAHDGGTNEHNNWEKQLRSIYANIPSGITQPYVDNLTTSFLKGLGEELKIEGYVDDLKNVSPSKPLAQKINSYLTSRVLLERDATDENSTEYKIKKDAITALVKDWEARIDDMRSNYPQYFVGVHDTDYQIWKNSLKEGYASIIVEPYACVYCNCGGQGNHPQYFNMQEANDELHLAMGDNVKSGYAIACWDSSQWQRYHNLIYPSTVSTSEAGYNVPNSNKGWGLYSIFGFGEDIDVNPTTPVIAVTYHDVNYWNNGALAEALWDGSWTNNSGEKVPFNLQTSDGREMTAEVLLEGLDKKLEAYDSGTLSEEEATIIGDNFARWLDARTVLTRVKNIYPDLALSDFKGDILRIIDFGDEYGQLNYLFNAPSTYKEGEQTTVKEIIALCADNEDLSKASWSSISSGIEGAGGSDAWLLYTHWLEDTTLPDAVRNDGATLPTKVWDDIFDYGTGIYNSYLKRLNISDIDESKAIREKMDAFAYDMAIRSAFYNAASVCLTEKNREIGSSTLSLSEKLGESLNTNDEGYYVVDNQQNSNDLKEFIDGKYQLELDGTAELIIGSDVYPTDIVFTPNTQFNIGVRVWTNGSTPQKVFDANKDSLYQRANFADGVPTNEKEAYVFRNILLNSGVKGNVNVIASLMDTVINRKLSNYTTPEEKLSVLAQSVSSYVAERGGNEGDYSSIVGSHIDTVGQKGVISGEVAFETMLAEKNNLSIISENVSVDKLFALTALGEGQEFGYNFFINEMAKYGVSVPEQLRLDAQSGSTDDNHKALARRYIYSLLYDFSINGLNYINTSSSTDYINTESDKYMHSPMFTAKQFGVTEEGDELHISIGALMSQWPEIDKALTVLSSAYDVGNPYSDYYVEGSSLEETEKLRKENRVVVQFILNTYGTSAGLMTVNSILPPTTGGVDPTPEYGEGEVFVPQWRINKSYSSLAPLLKEDSDLVTLQWYIDRSELSWGNKHYLYPDGSSKAKLYLKGYITDNTHDAYVVPSKSKSSNEKITYTSYSRTTKANSDITLYKVSTVDKLNMASWVSDTLKFNKYGKEFITYESKDVHTQTDSIVEDNFKVEFDYITDDTFTHEYRRGGKKNRRWYSENAYPSTDANHTYYDILGNFRCYNAEDTTSKPGAGITHSEDGYSEFTAVQGNLNVLPEVPMLYTDVNGNNSVHFTTGDKLRALKPLSYHTFEYDFGTIEPSIVGTSIATDQKSIALAGSLGLGNQGQVIHKGAGTTSSYEVDGVIRTKTYAIDIDDSSLKGTWNSGSTYSASAINKSFLESFATANATGGYTANIDAVENLMVDGNKLGDVYQSVTVTANGTSSERYELTVRAGVVTAVNGKKNWKTVYPELVPVIEEKLGLTPDKVFAAFASGKGDNLNEKAFETLSKALRENSSSIEEGKGWYSEDTTVLSLYVYTTEFEVPDMLFANKIPQEISAVSELATPRNKDNFYKVGRLGHLNLDLCLKGKDGAGNVINIKLTYNTANAYPTGKGYANAKKLYVIPNVSILDTTLNQ